MVKNALIIVLTGFVFSFNISAPKEWSEQTRLPQGVLAHYISKAIVDGVSPNMNVTKTKASVLEIKGPVTANSLLKAIPAAQIRMFPLYKVIESKLTTIGKISGALIVVSYAYGKTDMCAYQFVYLQREDLYTVTYTCALNSFKTLKPEFEASLKTLKMD